MGVPDPKVLYVVYWGAAEPLGQSIVLPPVSHVSEMGTATTLVTFEKPRDLAKEGEIERIRQWLASRKVRWVALRYHKTPKLAAKFVDLLQGVAAGLREAARGRPSIIHARTFVGGVVGGILAFILRAKLVYHNEGFYPDEQVDGGMWREGSLPHRLARLIERRLYARADGIVVLSQRTKMQVERLWPVRRRRTPVIVFPSCVDLELFRHPRRAPWQRDQPLRLVYVGSIGGRYLFQRVAEFVAVAYRLRHGSVSLRVLTGTTPSYVEEVLRDAGLPPGTYSIAYVSHARMPQELAQQDAGLFFLTRGLSEHGCSPTKVGEYWASGLPVVVTPNVSDTEDIVRREKVGVVLRDFSAVAYQRALRELLGLLEDPDTPNRCRVAAENYYAVAPASRRLQDLYLYLAGRRQWEADSPESNDAAGELASGRSTT